MKQLARAGVPRSLLARLEAGGDVQVSSLKRLLGALGCGFILLPISLKLLSDHKEKAEEERLRDIEWEQVRRELKLK